MQQLSCEHVDAIHLILLLLDHVLTKQAQNSRIDALICRTKILAVMNADMVKAIVFDMGGTLYDTPREIVTMIRFILNELEQVHLSNISDNQIIEVAERIDKLFDQRLVAENVGCHWLPSQEDSIEYARLILKALGVKGDLHRMAREAHLAWEDAYGRHKPAFLESCREALEMLHDRNYRLGIASNRRNHPKPHLEEAGILHLFDVVEYSCVPGYRKPSPYMLIQVAMVLSINPMRCAYVGDTVSHDVEAAQRADFFPILITWGDSSKARFLDDDVLVIEEMSELLNRFT